MDRPDKFWQPFSLGNLRLGQKGVFLKSQNYFFEVDGRRIKRYYVVVNEESTECFNFAKRRALPAIVGYSERRPAFTKVSAR